MEKDVAIREWCLEKALATMAMAKLELDALKIVDMAGKYEEYITSGNSTTSKVGRV